MQTIAKSYTRICLVGLALSLGGCDKGESKDAKSVADAKAKTEAKTEVEAPHVDVKALEEPQDDEEAPAEDAFDERVVKAAALAQKIEAEPTRADEILAEAGMDRVAFDALIFEVSSPELAEQYRLARAREDG